jgi:signal transduction histidine kinase
VRAAGDTPVVILTAKGEELDRLVGFGLGADDHVTKPFSPRELAARVQAVLRRANQERPTSSGGGGIRIGDLMIDGATREVERAGEPIPMIAREFDRRLLLAALIPVLLISMSTREVMGLFVVLAVSLAGSTLAGLLVLHLVDRASDLTIATRTFVGVAVGASVALANVLIVAALMFVNTAHDLGLTAALVVAGSAVTMLFGLRLARAAAREVVPLRELADGSLGERTLPGRTVEFAALSGGIERLRVQLRQVEDDRVRLDAERRKLIASISRDLRTPLVSIRAMAEALADGVVSDSDERTDYYQ